MKTHQISNMRFRASDLSEEMKLTKVKGAFKCDDIAARIILDAIEANGILGGTKDDINGMMVYGIDCSSISYENLELRKQREEEEKAIKEELEKNFAKAELWFETLSREEKEYVKLLGFYKFHIAAVG